MQTLSQAKIRNLMFWFPTWSPTVVKLAHIASRARLGLFTTKGNR